MANDGMMEYGPDEADAQEGAPVTSCAPAARVAKDADELLRQEGGAERLRAMVAEAEDGWRVTVARRFDRRASAQEKADAVAELLDLVAAQESTIAREDMLSELAHASGLSIKQLRAELKRIDTDGIDGNRDDRLALECAEAFYIAARPAGFDATAPHPTGNETVFDGGSRALAYHLDTWFRYTGHGWKAIPDGQMTCEVMRFIQRERLGKPSSSFCNNVLHNLRGMAGLDYDIQRPAWLDGRKSADGALCLANGILDVFDWIGTGTGCEPHTPELFTTTPLPYRYEPGADCPRWKAFLDQVLPDELSRTIMMEWFGHCLIPFQEFQKIMIMTGSGANGKSVVCDVLAALVGEKNCSSQPLESIHEGHNLKPLEGKLVNFSSELSRLCSGAEGVVKGISGGDTLTINPKNKDQHEAKMTARLVITTNDMPTVSDRTDAFFRRLIIIPFPMKIDEDKRRFKKEMVDEFRSELPGILNWALDSLRALMQRKRFLETQASADLKDELRLRSNTALEFFEETLIAQRSPNASLPKGAAYKLYTDWCRDNGIQHPRVKSDFGKMLADWVVSKHPSVSREDVLGGRGRVDGQRERMFRHVEERAFAEPETLD